MPLDRLRICGPEDVLQPESFLPKSDKTKLSSPWKRKGGRQSDSARPVFLKTGMGTLAKGSAYMEAGSTKLMCCVYGPRDLQRNEDYSAHGQIYCTFKYAPFSCQTRQQPQPSTEEKELAKMVASAIEPAVCLERFPKSQIDIHVMVLENDGGCVAHAITCAGLALANAGVDMYDLVIGCSASVVGGQVLLDPTAHEEGLSGKAGGMLMGYLPVIDQVSTFRAFGQCDMRTDTIDKLVRVCRKYVPVLRHCILNDVANMESS